MLEWLKTILGENYTEDIDTKVSAEIGKSFVSRADFNNLNTEKKKLDDTIKDRDEQLKTLQKSTGNIDDLKNQISNLQADNANKDKQHAAEIKQLKIDTAITAALTEAKAVNVKAVRALLDMSDIDKIELAEDGTVKGLSDKIAALQKAEDSKMLFNAGTKPKMKGAAPGETGNDSGETKVDITKMSYEELEAYMAENPDAEI